MTLKTWFKGLAVFVLNSLITAGATMTLDPASFNFSKEKLQAVGLSRERADLYSRPATEIIHQQWATHLLGSNV